MSCTGSAFSPGMTHLGNGRKDPNVFFDRVAVNSLVAVPGAVEPRASGRGIHPGCLGLGAAGDRR